MTDSTELLDMMVTFAKKPQLPRKKRKVNSELEETLRSAHQQIMVSLGLHKAERHGVNSLRSVIGRALETYNNTYRSLGLLVVSKTGGIGTKSISDVGVLKQLADSPYAKEKFVQDELYKAFYFAGFILLAHCHTIFASSRDEKSYSKALALFVVGMDSVGHGMKFEVLANQKRERSEGGLARTKKFELLKTWIDIQAPKYWQEDKENDLRIKDIVRSLYCDAIEDPTRFRLSSPMDIPEESFFRKRIRKHPDFPGYLSIKGRPKIKKLIH